MPIKFIGNQFGLYENDYFKNNTQSSEVDKLRNLVFPESEMATWKKALLKVTPIIFPEYDDLRSRLKSGEKLY